MVGVAGADIEGSCRRRQHDAARPLPDLHGLDRRSVWPSSTVIVLSFSFDTKIRRPPAGARRERGEHRPAAAGGTGAETGQGQCGICFRPVDAQRVELRELVQESRLRRDRDKRARIGKQDGWRNWPSQGGKSVAPLKPPSSKSVAAHERRDCGGIERCARVAASPTRPHREPGAVVARRSSSGSPASGSGSAAGWRPTARAAAPRPKATRPCVPAIGRGSGGAIGKIVAEIVSLVGDDQQVIARCPG